MGRSTDFRSMVLPLLLISILDSEHCIAAQQERPVTALISAYPSFLDRIEGNALVWKDGTRMRIDDGKGVKPFEAMLDDPDIKDMFAMPYPAGDKGIPPPSNFDPGRIRYTPFFAKVYGDCQKSDILADAVNVVWLPRKYGKPVRFSRINGAATALRQVSDELDGLPDRFLDYVRPTQGTYNCRPIAGTNRPSAHGFGIAIDMAEAHANYWQWSKPDARGEIPYKNDMPWEIVRTFEKHGFIWGGKWYHYDTMHFEYRPEMLLTGR
jgi:hypothetical protein